MEENIFDCAKIYLNIIEKYILIENFSKEELNDEVSLILKISDEKVNLFKASNEKGKDYFQKREITYLYKKTNFKLMKVITENKKIFFLESLLRLKECEERISPHLFESKRECERIKFLLGYYSSEIEIVKKIYSTL